MKFKKKLLPIAIALNLILSTTPITAIAHAEETAAPSLTERVQKILHPTSDSAPAAEPTEESQPEPEQTDQNEPEEKEKYDSDSDEDNVKNKDKADASSTSWDGAGYTQQECPKYALCDGAPTSSTSDWNNILILIGSLFGSDGTNTNNTGYTGDSGYGTETIGTPTDIGIGDNTSTVDTPSGDFSTVTPSGSPDSSWSDVPAGPDLSNVQLGILGGIPISANASYSYSWQGPGSFRVLATVNPANPEIDQTTTFSALVTPTISSVHVSPSTQSVSETYTQGGDYSKVFVFQTMEYAKDKKPRYGKLTVKVNAKVYEGSTSLCSESDADCNNELIGGDEFDQSGKTGGTTGTGGSTDIGGTITNPDTNTGTTTGGTSTGGTTTDDFGNLVSGTTGTSNNNGSSGLLDNIFANTGSGSNYANNANNPDWLNDGFSNIASSSGSADNVPEDFGSQFSAENGIGVGTGTGDGIDPATGVQIAQNSAENAANGQPYTDTGNNQNAADYGYSGSASSPASAAAGENPADGALGSVFAKIDSAIGNDPAAAGSLTSKLAALTNTANNAVESATGFNLKGDSKALPGSERGSSSGDGLAEMRETATRMLTAYGRNPEDIKNGKLYDAGSAYTDPRDAWNLNRMTAAKAQAQVKQSATTPIVK